MLREAILHPLSPTSDRLQGANAWSGLCQTHAHPSELEAAKETLKLIDLAVTESSSLEGISSRLSEHTTFRHARRVASNAAALALEGGDSGLAVSLLEQGRSTILTRLSRYRGALDDVHKASPHLAIRFVELSAKLNALVLHRGEVSSEDMRIPGNYEDNASR